MIADNVKKVFEDNLWFLATCGEEPNVVPVGFKRITEDGTFVIGAILLDTTLENIKKSDRIAIAAANPLTAEAYQIKGKAVLTTEGSGYEHYAKLADDTYHGRMPAKCAIVVTPEKLIVVSPNAENKQELSL